MVHKYPCPKCGKSNAVRYGKIRLKRGYTQRLRCLSCNRTSLLSYREPFFRRMRTPEHVIHNALEKYINLISIRKIARELKVRPNTIVNWVMKVYDDPLQYKTFMKKSMRFSDRAAVKFFSNIRKATRKRVTRLDKRMLVKKLDDIFRPFEERATKVAERHIYTQSHPVSSGRYDTRPQKDDEYDDDFSEL